MKIKNLKYILVFFVSLLSFCSVSFGDCNTNRPTACNDTSTFDNNRIVNLGGSSLVYLKMFDINTLGCTSSTVSEVADIVKNIQHSLNENCGANICEDWRFGSGTREALERCAADYCRGMGSVAPILVNDSLTCSDPLYELDDTSKCCISKACEKLYETEYLSEMDENGLCPDGSAKDTLYNCCINVSSVCDSETGYVNLRSITPNNTGLRGKCEDCGYGKKPSEDRLKCVCDSSEACCGVELYLGIPFIGDCIEMNSDSSRPNTTTVSNVSAFPILMQGLMKIVMSLILVVSFLLVIVSGLMMTAGAFKSTSFDKGKTMIKNVIISLILLGLSGLILKLINPSFFGG